MGWYDRFATFYDSSLERLYTPYRARAAEAAALGRGCSVLLPACGTGQDLPHLADRVGPSGRILGVDVSSGMLDRARARAESAGWACVELRQCDLLEINDESFDALVWFLGLSVVPEWEALFAHTFSLLAPGGRCVIFDIHAERWVPQTSWVQLIARADLRRKVWEPLADFAEDFELTELDGSAHIHGGTPILATGTKPGSYTLREVP